MLYRISMFFFLVFASSGYAYSQVNIDTGLFIKPSAEDEQKNMELSFSGNLQEGSGSAGLSLRVGSLIFGLETIRNSSQSNFSSSFQNGNGGSVSANFSSSTGPQHRAMMGIKLSRNVALYGFHGLSGLSQNHNLSYHESHQENQTVVWGCGYTKEVPVTWSSFGSGSFDFSRIQNTIGAGMEAFMLGGVLRLEYNMTRRNGFKQTVNLNHSTSNLDYSNPSNADSYEYNWKPETEQLLQLRWKTRF